MQFTKTFVTLALAAGVLANPTWSAPKPTGGAQCCQNVKNSSQVDSVTKGLLKTLLGIDISALNVPIGTGCAPISVLGGVSCNTNKVQCGQVFARKFGSMVDVNADAHNFYSSAHWRQLHSCHYQCLIGQGSS
jgi:hypothetical protein